MRRAIEFSLSKLGFRWGPSSTKWSVVAGTDRDGGDSLRSFQCDAVECAVGDQVCRSIDEAVLITEVGLDRGELGVYLHIRVLNVEDASAGFRGKVGEGFGAC